MLSRISLKWRVAIGFMGVLGATLVAVLIAGGQLHRSYNVNLKLARELAPKIAVASEIRIAYDVQNSNLRGYAVLGKSSFREKYMAASLESRSAVDKLGSFPQSSAERKLLVSLNSQAHTFGLEAERILMLVDSGRRSEAFQRQQTELEKLTGDISNLASEYARTNQVVLDARLASLDSNVYKTQMGMALAGGVALLVALLVVLTTTHAVSEPARRLIAAAEALQKDDYQVADDLEVWRKRQSGAAGDGRNEMLRLASSFTSMVRELRKRQDYLTAYGEVSTLCASAIDLTQLLNGVIQKLAQRTDSQVGVAHIISTEGDKLIPMGSYASGAALSSTELTMGEGIPGEAAKNTLTLVVSDVPENSGFAVNTGAGEIKPRSIISVPLVSENETLGVVTLASLHEYSLDTIDFLGKSAGAIAAAVHNAMTHAEVNKMAGQLSEKNELLEDHNQELQAQNEEIQAQATELEELNEELSEQRSELEQTLETARDRAHELSVLWEVGKTITASLDFSDLVSTIEDQIRTLLDADASSIMLYDEHKQGLFFTSGRQLRRKHAVPQHIDQCESISSEVAKTGEPRIVQDVLNCEHCKYGSMACADGGTHHMLSVPMFYNGEAIGAINAFRQNKSIFSDSDIQVLSTLSSAVAVALINARAYDKERQIAEKLQKSFLPRENLSVPGFGLGCLYNPATEGTKVGGDFYDVIELPEGKAAVVLGDVSGKGIDAAVYTAMVKYMLRAFVLSSSDLTEALAKLNNAVQDLAPPEIFITMFVGILDTEKREMQYVNAGHDQPLFYQCGKGICLPCDVTGRAVGMLPDADYSSRTIKFESGDMMVLYTDGVTDARRDGHFLGLEGLEKLVMARVDKPADEIVTQVFADLRKYTGSKLSDDVAIMIVKAD